MMMRSIITTKIKMDEKRKSLYCKKRFWGVLQLWGILLYARNIYVIYISINDIGSDSLTLPKV